MFAHHCEVKRSRVRVRVLPFLVCDFLLFFDPFLLFLQRAEEVLEHSFSKLTCLLTVLGLGYLNQSVKSPSTMWFPNCELSSSRQRSQLCFPGLFSRRLCLQRIPLTWFASGQNIFFPPLFLASSTNAFGFCSKVLSLRLGSRSNIEPSHAGCWICQTN